MDLILIISAFVGGIGCLVMHPRIERLVGLIGPGLAFASMQLRGELIIDSWTYFGLNVAAAVAGGWAFGYGRMAKLRAIADADD